MKLISIFLLFLLFIFPNIQSENSIFLSKYEENVNFLAENGLKDTKYCKSVLMPTESTLKQALQSTFAKTKSDTFLDENIRIDSCCRSLHKCDAIKNDELNQTISVPISNCECVSFFQTCLKNLNTKISNEFLLIYSINTTKCHSNKHPIIKCIKYEETPETSLIKLSTFAEREKYFKRCTSYELDGTRKTESQLFDVAFNETTGEYWVTKHENIWWFYLLFCICMKLAKHQ